MNYGLSLSIWDYIFRTAYTPYSGRDIEIGFHGDSEFPKEFGGQITHGFGKKDASLKPKINTVEK